ncbi:MAG: VWA domain-containing protein [Myxococcales bacterium]|nr:VWA domain-containing protein [Myxococcales bacterium]
MKSKRTLLGVLLVASLALIPLYPYLQAWLKGKGLVFANPWYLLLLYLIPLWALMRWFVTREGTLKFSNVRTLKQISPGFRARLARVPWVLRLLVLALLVVAFARPQKEDQTVAVEGEGVDIVICLDLSISMNAIDKSYEQIQALISAGKQPKNRFEVAREVLKNFVSKRKADRIGLVVFGRDAFLSFPLSTDRDRLFNKIDELGLDDRISGRGEHCSNNCTISGAGTVIGDALAQAFNLLRESKLKSRVIVLITDGEEFIPKDDPPEDHVKATVISEYLANRQDVDPIKIYTFLIGSQSQPYIPATDFFGRSTYRPVNFSVNPKLLQDIAKKNGGQFYPVYDEEMFKRDFNKLVKSKFKETIKFKRDDVFPPILLAAFCLLFFELLLQVAVLRRFP